jgi:uncharacterized protein YbjQ (UPF0145 family)
MHPLSGSFEKLKDSELEEKDGDLSRKYFLSQNSEVRSQIVALLEDYKEELSKRRASALNRMMNNRDKGLDKLINVN